MSTSSGYRAPFLPGGSEPVSIADVEKWLALALSYGGDFADLFFEYDVTGSFSFEDHILKSTARGISMGVGIRVRKGDATGMAYSESLDPAAIKQAALTAAQIARDGKEVAPVAIKLKERAHPTNRYKELKSSFEAGLHIKKQLLSDADNIARGLDPRVSRVEASFVEHHRDMLLASSDGTWVTDTQPMIRFGCRVVLEDGTKRESGSSGGGGRVGMEYFDEKSVVFHAEEAVRQARVMLDAIEAPAGEMDVVLAKGDSGILLHEAVGHGLEADFNRKKTSTYSDQIGQKVASELCTVVDDATHVGSRGSIHVDDEGEVPTKTVLIEKGILKGYMHDKHSAEHYKLAPTGNGRRESFRAKPLPRMTNTLMLGGQDDPGDIIRSVKRGVYAKKFGGGQVNIGNGDFVFSLTEGYMIEDGKITAPVKGVNLIGNGPDAMRKVVSVGHDMELSDGIWTCGKEGQSVPVGVASPTVKIAPMTVGGTKIS